VGLTLKHRIRDVEELDAPRTRQQRFHRGNVADESRPFGSARPARRSDSSLGRAVRARGALATEPLGSTRSAPGPAEIDGHVASAANAAMHFFVRRGSPHLQDRRAPVRGFRSTVAEAGALTRPGEVTPSRTTSEWWKLI
jgi:hypothetical protein